MPPDGIAGVKELHKKLASGLHDIKANSERDAEYELLMDVRLGHVLTNILFHFQSTEHGDRDGLYSTRSSKSV